MLTTGLLPRREEARENMVAFRPSIGASLDTVIQPVAWIRDQELKPSCVGQSLAAGIDAVVGGPPFASAVDIWKEARRRQRNLENVLVGTRSEYAIAAVIEQGWTPYKRGEDSRPISADDDLKGTIEDDMFSHDMRQTGALHYTILSDRVERTVEALRLGFAVVGSWGLQDTFMRTQPNQVVEADQVDSGRNGHAMRIFAYDADRGLFAIQNSWGRFWSHMYLGDQRYDGCCLMSESALRAAWDLDVLHIQKVAA